MALILDKKVLGVIFVLVSLLVFFLYVSLKKNKIESEDLSLTQAVMDRDLKRVKDLVAKGANLEERDNTSSTSLIIACATKQFEMAEYLIMAGANIYAFDEMDATAGTYAANRPFPLGSPQRVEQDHLLKLLESRGFPMPPPSREELLKLVKEGKWPPKK